MSIASIGGLAIESRTKIVRITKKWFVLGTFVQYIITINEVETCLDPE